MNCENPKIWGNHLCKNDNLKPSYQPIMFNEKLSRKLSSKWLKVADSKESSEVQASRSVTEAQEKTEEFGDINFTMNGKPVNVVMSQKSFKSNSLALNTASHLDENVDKFLKNKVAKQSDQQKEPLKTISVPSTIESEDCVEDHNFENTSFIGQSYPRYLSQKKKDDGNFVKLNLKKKIYCRYKKNLTGVKFKRKQWKERQKKRLAMEENIGRNNGTRKKRKGDAIRKSEPKKKRNHQDTNESNVSEPLKSLSNQECPSQISDQDDSCESFEPNITDEESFSIDDALKVFKIKKLKDFQEKAIRRTLSNLSTLVIMPTGTGKSLCYQIPAYLNYKRNSYITLVVSPLISLMQDQIQNLPKVLKGAAINSSMDYAEKIFVRDEIIKGNIAILFMSPESLIGQGRKFLQSIVSKKTVKFACIDEVHCISTWAHNFRPSYLRLCKILQKDIGIEVILGLTATATRFVENSILSHIQVQEQIEVFRSPPINEKIELSVIKSDNKLQDLVSLLQNAPCISLSSIIIYCSKRIICSQVASYLRSYFQDNSEFPASSIDIYHAGLPLTKRKVIQRKFMKGQLKILIATVALGMGFHKKDLQCVIHFNLPSNYENYVQEIGRAGRNNDQSWSFVFIENNQLQLNELERDIYCKSIARSSVRKLLDLIYVPCKCKMLSLETENEKWDCYGHERAISVDEITKKLNIGQEVIETVLCYIETIDESLSILNPICNKVIVKSYLGYQSIVSASRDCKPLSIALALNSFQENSMIEASIVEIANKLGWKSEDCLQHFWILKSLKGSGDMLVEFEDFSYLVKCVGTKTESDLEMLLDLICQRTKEHEDRALIGIHDFYCTMENFSHTIRETGCNSENLKASIESYFTRSDIRNIKFIKDSDKKEELQQIIKKFIGIYSSSQNFTARSIAKIFYGIDSPNYPAVYWSKNPFWRAHMTFKFTDIVDTANEELIKWRS